MNKDLQILAGLISGSETARSTFPWREEIGPISEIAVAKCRSYVDFGVQSPHLSLVSWVTLARHLTFPRISFLNSKKDGQK